ncbi:phage tail protein [Escherichia coli]|uniref:gp53-like domain-containing protein n=1 Tax=Escherichia coli TaxID=562 RepID=UPI000B5C1477|nr:phage tail protein [Escherichia coli]EFB1613270.1 phage tail protein [Escherichia coli]EFH5450030.1 phage tail protein [Escherichia coli]EFN5101692.1 phage tail protein [Escherichia coli]EFQ6900661.1 phage tail protein [Escherichia coli]EGI4127242.1 phage tail protein [Escherichia coli]
MAKNDFKAFATDRNANVISQEEWEALPALLSGFTAGKASSAQVNKVIRQASFIAAALAQFVSDKTQRDVLDNGDLPGFVELLGSGFAVEYLSRKNPFGDIKSDGTVKTALENLGLRASGQYTDNLLFTGPDGLKIQVFRRTLANLTTVGVVNSVPVTFPVPFPVNCWGVFSTKLTWVQITNSCEWVSNTGFTAQVMMNIAVNTNTSDAMFLAIGY